LIKYFLKMFQYNLIIRPFLHSDHTPSYECGRLEGFYFTGVRYRLQEEQLHTLLPRSTAYGTNIKLYITQSNCSTTSLRIFLAHRDYTQSKLSLKHLY